MDLDDVADKLGQLVQWRTNQLVDDDEFATARDRLVQAIRFPSTMGPSDVQAGLEKLKSLAEQRLINEAELKEKKGEVLAKLLPPSCKPKAAAKQSAVTSVRLQKPGGRSIEPATDDRSSDQDVGDRKYFGYYADFAHQELMLNDAVRTGTYQRAIFQNRADFEGKVVIDVGTGTGILAMFAAQAGARKVYAVEASEMADVAAKLIAHNGLSDVVEVVKGKVEEVQIPEKADVLISEPLGFWLFNEQMIQSYVAARDRWLKPGGKMFPCHAAFFTAPCYVPETRKATLAKSAPWLAKQDFYGLDMSCLESDCQKQHLERMIVDQVFPSQVVAPATRTTVDFTTITVEQLNDMVYPLEWDAPSNVLWDAVGLWFDTFFVGSTETVCLSTRPDEKLTCWYQTLCLLPEAMLQKKFYGKVTLVANPERTYDVGVYGGPEPTDRDAFLRTYGFTLPVYRYYEHFQDLIWDITLFPELRMGKASQLQVPRGPVSAPPPYQMASYQPQHSLQPIANFVPRKDAPAFLPAALIPATTSPSPAPFGVHANGVDGPAPSNSDFVDSKRARKDGSLSPPSACCPEEPGMPS